MFCSSGANYSDMPTDACFAVQGQTTLLCLLAPKTENNAECDWLATSNNFACTIFKLGTNIVTTQAGLRL